MQVCTHAVQHCMFICLARVLVWQTFGKIKVDQSLLFDVVQHPWLAADLSCCAQLCQASTTTRQEGVQHVDTCTSIKRRM